MPQRITRQQLKQQAKETEHGTDEEGSDAVESEEDAPQSEEDDEGVLPEAKSTEVTPTHHRNPPKKRSLSTGPVLPDSGRRRNVNKLHKLYSPGAPEEGPSPVELLQICVKPRKKLTGWEDLPELVINIDPHATVMELQAEIHKQCPLLPPKAQQLYVQNAVTGVVVKLQPWGGEGEFKLLEDFGLTLGHQPRTIWAELDADILGRLTGGDPIAVPAPADPIRSRPVPGPRDDGSDWLTSPASSSRHQNQSPAQPVAASAAAPAAQAAVGGRGTLDIVPVGQQLRVSAAMPTGAAPRAHQPLPQGSAPVHQAAQSVNGERRRVKRWDAEETEALLAGIEAHGYSNWKLIQVLPIFYTNINRTTIDLKDKWRLLRNMVINNTPPRVWPPGLNLNDTIARIWRIIHVNEPHLRHRVPSGIVDQD